MKNMNLQETPQMGLKEVLLNKIGDHLAKRAVDPRNCWWGNLYEPSLSSDMIEEMLIDN